MTFLCETFNLSKIEIDQYLLEARSTFHSMSNRHRLFWKSLLYPTLLTPNEDSNCNSAFFFQIYFRIAWFYELRELQEFLFFCMIQLIENLTKKR